MNPAEYENLTPEQAIAHQHELRKRVHIKPLEKPIRTIGGADISFNKHEETVYAGIVVFSYPDMKLIGTSTAISRTSFPYVSGLLAFREVPGLLEAWEKLTIKPDVMVLDGQGIAYERRLGIATHFGLETGVPTLGCAKSRLAGTFDEPLNTPLAQSKMYHDGEQVGVVLRSKVNCNPLYISPGYLISIDQSVEVIINCIGKHRIPEPTRQAHLLVNQIRVANGDKKDSQLDLFG